MTRFNLAGSVVLLLVTPLVFGGEASKADSPDPATVIEMRRQGFKDMGAAFKGVRDQFRRPKPVMVMIREYTKPLVRYSNEPVLEHWFPEGTGPDQGIETEALPVIWERPEEFAALWEDYTAATSDLQAALASGDMGIARDQARKVGETCTSCHDVFRAEEK